MFMADKLSSFGDDGNTKKRFHHSMLFCLNVGMNTPDIRRKNLNALYQKLSPGNVTSQSQLACSAIPRISSFVMFPPLFVSLQQLPLHHDQPRFPLQWRHQSPSASPR
jgi:hypothetical protein